MNEQFDFVVIGAGQAGLAISYYLTQMQRKHIILEKASAITPEWRHRWDSFTLVLPNWTVQMPDRAYQSDDPDGFMGRDELVAYFEQYAASFDPEIRFDCEVTALEKNPNGTNYLLHLNGRSIEAGNVVVAAGTFQQPRIPAFSRNLSAEFKQIHSSEYRNPDALPDGAILVVGSGQSGCQIAEELYQNGRKVFFSIGSAMRVPRRYRGKDSIWWLGEIGFFDQTVDSLPSSRARFAANPFLSGKDGGHDLNLHQFARDGVVLLGHIAEAQEHKLILAPDLFQNLAKVDQFVLDFERNIDKLIADRNMEAPEAPPPSELKDGYASAAVEELDLSAEGIKTIIWSTGYKFDYSWIKLPLLDQDGFPTHDRGISSFPGLYFLGLGWLHKRKSGLVWGVGEDAAYLAQHIAAQPVP